MKISIALTTYNGEKYILEQLISLKEQTLKPNEIIITDDCSLDDTLNVIDEFSKLVDFEVKVYKNETNLGYTQNFAKALSLCTGELIFLCDQDDYWFLEKLEYMTHLASKYVDKELFMCDAQMTDSNLKPTEFTKQSQIKSMGLDKKNFVTGCCIAVRKKFVDKLLPIPLEFKGHDNWIVNIADDLDKRYIDSKVLQYYRRHGDNESNAQSSMIRDITWKDKLTLLSIRVKRKFDFHVWIEYSIKQKLLKQKIQEIKNEN